VTVGRWTLVIMYCHARIRRWRRTSFPLLIPTCHRLSNQHSQRRQKQKGVQTDDLERIVASDQFGLTDEKRRRSRRRRWRKSNYSTTKTWKQIVSFWFRDALWKL